MFVNNILKYNIINIYFLNANTVVQDKLILIKILKVSNKRDKTLQLY